MASSRFKPLATLLRKYLEGFSIDSPTSAFAAKCMTASGRIFARIGSDRLSIRQIAFDKNSARIDRGAMPFGQVIEDRDLVAFVEKQLGADAADVTGAADDKNLHAATIANARR